MNGVMGAFESKPLKIVLGQFKMCDSKFLVEEDVRPVR